MEIYYTGIVLISLYLMCFCVFLFIFWGSWFLAKLYWYIGIAWKLYSYASKCILLKHLCWETEPWLSNPLEARGLNGFLLQLFGAKLVRKKKVVTSNTKIGSKKMIDRWIYKSGWVVEPTHLEKYSSNWIISPGRGENKKSLKPPPTPPKTNVEPKNEGLEDYFPFQKVDFQVPC